MHAISVGLAVVDLATDQADGTRVAASVLKAALTAVSKSRIINPGQSLQSKSMWRTTMTKLLLIIGAGPVGMTMASELARYGVALRIIDKAPGRTDKSKALVLWSRTLELLDRGGGSTPFVDAGFKARRSISLQATRLSVASAWTACRPHTPTG